MIMVVIVSFLIYNSNYQHRMLIVEEFCGDVDKFFCLLAVLLVE